jgi:hypothetical protein
LFVPARNVTPVTSEAATSVRAVAGTVVRVAVPVPSATVRGRSVVVAGMVADRAAIVRTARTATVLMATVPMVIVRKVTGRARKASGSGRRVISVIAPATTVVIVRTVIVRTVIVRTVTARMAIVLMAIAHVPSAIVPAATARMATVLRATGRVRSAIVRMVRRVVTARTVIVRTVIAPMVTAPMATVRVRTAAPVASVAAVAQPSRL